MEFKDYYKTLGVDRAADAATIKKSFRKLAGKYHPDKNQGNKAAEEKFKLINEANEVLSDPDKRRRYDQLGSQWNEPGAAGGGQKRGSRSFSESEMGEMFGGRGGGTDGNSGGFSDFFETFFGRNGMGGGAGPGEGRQGGAWGAQGRPGNDYQADVEITLEEAYAGARKIFEINGKKLKLAFKPGISDGKIIRLEGKGGPGSGGAPDGDLHLRIHVLPHSVLERRGDDLHMTLDVEVQDAVAGKVEELSTLGRSVKLRIPPGTDNGKVFRLKGQGMAAYDGGAHGDLYVTVRLRLPRNLNPAETEFLKQMSESRRE